MKKIIMFLLIMLCLNIDTIYPQGITKRQSLTINLELFNGTWEYSSGNIIFRILLKIGTEETNLFLGSCLIGDYFYSNKGIVMDSYNEIFIPTIYNEVSKKTIIIYASNGNTRADRVRPNYLYMYFKDKRTNSKTFSGSIELITPTQIHWMLKGDEGVSINDDSDNGFSVPTDVIMNKK